MILESIAKCLANSNVSYNNLVELIDRCLLIMVLVLGGVCYSLHLLHR